MLLPRLLLHSLPAECLREKADVEVALVVMDKLMESWELVVGVPVVAHLILGPESASCHASKSRARAKFDQAFKLAMCKEEILSFNPVNGGSEMVREELDEDGAHKLLAQ